MQSRHLFCALVALPLATSAAGAPGCLTIAEPYITAGALAQAVAAFRSLPAAQRLGPAPDPGLRRIVSPLELNRYLREIGQKAGDERLAREAAVEQSVCLVRSSRLITPQEVEAAMRRLFVEREVTIEVLEVSKRPVGEGSLEFSLQQLPRNANPELAITWNGWMVETDGRKRAAWARVRLAEKVRRLVAAKDLKAGEIVDLSNTAYQEMAVFPGLPAPEPELFGRAARKPIAAGEVIAASQVAPVPVIQKGDALTLEVVSNQTRLSVDGRAESTAYAGQRMSVSTPMFKRTVQAVAKGKGRAVVDAEPARKTTKSIPE